MFCAPKKIWIVYIGHMFEYMYIVCFFYSIYLYIIYLTNIYIFIYIYIVTTKRIAVCCQSPLLRNLSQNPSPVMGFPLQLMI